MVERMFRKVWLKLFGIKVDFKQNVWYNYSVENKKEKGGLDMENLIKVLSSYKGFKFKVANEKINQLERNAFKSAFINALMLDLNYAGFEVGLVDKGIAVLVDNDELGPIAVVLDSVVKGLEYDFDYEVSAEAIKMAEKADKASKVKASKEAVA
jgi:hypothetical protein